MSENNFRIFLVPAMIMGSILLFLYGCEKINTLKEKAGGKVENQDLMKEIEQIYNKAKKAGENVPDNVMEWALQDIKKMGDWEYRIIRIKSNNIKEIEEALVEEGKLRWECFWISENDESRIYYLRRPARSYLKHRPFKDLLRILPDEQAP